MTCLTYVSRVYGNHFSLRDISMQRECRRNPSKRKRLAGRYVQ